MRAARIAEPGVEYHLLNRRVMRLRLFEKGGDYGAFERVLAAAAARPDAPRLLACCLMPNHWHLVVQAGSGRTCRQVAIDATLQPFDASTFGSPLGPINRRFRSVYGTHALGWEASTALPPGHHVAATLSLQVAGAHGTYTLNYADAAYDHADTGVQSLVPAKPLVIAAGPQGGQDHTHDRSAGFIECIGIGALRDRR